MVIWRENMTFNKRKLVIYILSDSLGETAQYVARASASQFPEYEVTYKQIPYIPKEEYLRETISNIDGKTSLLMFTLVVDSIKTFVVNICQKLNIHYVDILSSPIDVLSQFTSTKPLGKPGIVERMDDAYFRKIEAIEFAIKYDDGKDNSGIREADLILLGISRTSKTPLSMYLAYRGLKVMNIPLVPNVPIIEEIYQVPKRKIIALTIRPDVLEDIRKERLKTMGVQGYSAYNDLGKILDELDYAEKVAKRIGCPVIDVSHKAVEETANTIMQIYMSRGDKSCE